MVTEIASGADGRTALAVVGTIVHDGAGGVTDIFDTDTAVRAWVTEFWPGAHLSDGGPDAVRRIRRASRAAFAATVHPAPPSAADADRLMASAESGRVLTDAVAALHVRVDVEVGQTGVSASRSTPADGDELVVGLLALAVTDFLCGPNAERLRSCQAPRCVRYFLQDHGRQHWCKPSCGNRARAARFVERRADTS